MLHLRLKSTRSLHPDEVLTELCGAFLLPLPSSPGGGNSRGRANREWIPRSGSRKQPRSRQASSRQADVMAESTCRTRKRPSPLLSSPGPTTLRTAGSRPLDDQPRPNAPAASDGPTAGEPPPRDEAPGLREQLSATRAGV